MKPIQLSRDFRHGFNLVELVVVVAIMGVIAAVAIPSLSNVSGGARKASSQRNAQHVVTIYEAGAAAGIKWSGSDRNSKVAAVVAGAQPEDGPFAGRTFTVPNIGGTDLTDTYPYIGLDAASGDLFYDEAGAQSST
jgi:type IV pilus assembly protein PilA